MILFVQVNLFIFNRAQVMPKNLWVGDDLIEEFGVGQDSLIDIMQFFLVTQIFQQFLIDERQREQVLLASIVCRELLKEGF